MKQRFSASVWQEGDWYIAQCVQIDVTSQGTTEDDALNNLRDAIELHFTPPVATIKPHSKQTSEDVKLDRAPTVINIDPENTVLKEAKVVFR